MVARGADSVFMAPGGVNDDVIPGLQGQVGGIEEIYLTVVAEVDIRHDHRVRRFGLRGAIGGLRRPFGGFGLRLRRRSGRLRQQVGGDFRYRGIVKCIAKHHLCRRAMYTVKQIGGDFC